MVIDDNVDEVASDMSDLINVNVDENFFPNELKMLISVRFSRIVTHFT